MADTNKFVEFENYVFRDEQGNPIVTVGNISDKTTQSFTFSSALKDKDGAIVTGEIIMGLKTSQGKTENIFLPASSSTDGINFSNAVRGIKINGIELASGIPTGDSAFALDDIPEGAVVENVFHPIQLQMLYAVIKGQIASGGNAWRVGNKINEDIYFYADNASANTPNFRYKNSLSRWEWSDDGVSWTGFGSAGTHGTTANISDHADVDSTVSSAMTDGDILYAEGGKLKRLAKGTDGQGLKLNSGLPAWENTGTAGAYDSSWNGDTNAPTKDAVYDKIESMSTSPVFLSGSFSATGNTSGTETISMSRVGTSAHIIIYDGTANSNGFSSGTNNSCTWQNIINTSNPYGGSTSSSCFYDSYNPYYGYVVYGAITFSGTDLVLNWTNNSSTTRTVNYKIIVY